MIISSKSMGRLFIVSKRAGTGKNYLGIFFVVLFLFPWCFIKASSSAALMRPVYFLVILILFFAALFCGVFVVDGVASLGIGAPVNLEYSAMLIRPASLRACWISFFDCIRHSSCAKIRMRSERTESSVSEGLNPNNPRFIPHHSPQSRQVVLCESSHRTNQNANSY